MKLLCQRSLEKCFGLKHVSQKSSKVCEIVVMHFAVLFLYEIRVNPRLAFMAHDLAQERGGPLDANPEASRYLDRIG